MANLSLYEALPGSQETSLLDCSIMGVNILILLLIWSNLVAICMAGCAIPPDENGHVTIPDDWSGLDNGAIPNQAFYGCSALQSVTMILVSLMHLVVFNGIHVKFIVMGRDFALMHVLNVVQSVDHITELFAPQSSSHRCLSASVISSSFKLRKVFFG